MASVQEIGFLYSCGFCGHHDVPLPMESTTWPRTWTCTLCNSCWMSPIVEALIQGEAFAHYNYMSGGRHPFLIPATQAASTYTASPLNASSLETTPANEATALHNATTIYHSQVFPTNTGNQSSETSNTWQCTVDEYGAARPNLSSIESLRLRTASDHELQHDTHLLSPEYMRTSPTTDFNLRRLMPRRAHSSPALRSADDGFPTHVATSPITTSDNSYQRGSESHSRLPNVIYGDEDGHRAGSALSDADIPGPASATRRFDGARQQWKFNFHRRFGVCHECRKRRIGCKPKHLSSETLSKIPQEVWDSCPVQEWVPKIPS